MEVSRIMSGHETKSQSRLEHEDACPNVAQCPCSE